MEAYQSCQIKKLPDIDALEGTRKLEAIYKRHPKIMHRSLTCQRILRRKECTPGSQSSEKLLWKIKSSTFDGIPKNLAPKYYSGRIRQNKCNDTIKELVKIPFEIKESPLLRINKHWQNIKKSRMYSEAIRRICKQREETRNGSHKPVDTPRLNKSVKFLRKIISMSREEVTRKKSTLSRFKLTSERLWKPKSAKKVRFALP